MALATDADANLHALVHTLPPDFDLAGSIDELAPGSIGPSDNPGLLGGYLEESMAFEYLHLRWRPGEPEPERFALPGLEDVEVQWFVLEWSAALTLVVDTNHGRWRGAFDGDRCGPRWDRRVSNSGSRSSRG